MVTLFLACLLIAAIICAAFAAFGAVLLPIIDVMVAIAVIMLLVQFIKWVRDPFYLDREHAARKKRRTKKKQYDDDIEIVED